MGGIPALDLWDLVVEVLHSSKKPSNTGRPVARRNLEETHQHPRRRNTSTDMMLNCSMWITWSQMQSLLKASLSSTFSKIRKCLRIGLRKRRIGKSDVPVKQRGGWPNAIHTDRRKITLEDRVSFAICFRGQTLQRPERQDQLQRKREDPVIRTSRCANCPSFRPQDNRVVQRMDYMAVSATVRNKGPTRQKQVVSSSSDGVLGVKTLENGPHVKFHWTCILKI